MSLLEPSATKWIPGLFMDEAVVDSIRNEGSDKEIDTSTNLNEIVINRGGSISGSESHEWDNYPDGIRIEDYKGKTFNAHIMVIRDGCEFGPVLIVNGEVNQAVYSGNSGYNPRTAIGQRQDGAVIFVCADGRQAGSIGATYKDVIDILQEYGAYNACNMDGGSSSIMYYRNTSGEVKMINSYSVLQSEPRRMPDFWMVQ